MTRPEVTEMAPGEFPELVGFAVAARVQVREDIGRDLGNLAAEPGLGPAARTGLAALQRHDAATLTRVRDLLVALERTNGRTY